MGFMETEASLVAKPISLFEKFQKIGGFIQCLRMEIQKNVLSKDPQTLDEVIKQSHVYVNPSEENEEKTPHKNTCTYAFDENRSYNNSKKKRKNNNDNNTHIKKTKSFLKPLSKEYFERDKKENLCFLFMGSNPKRDGPK